MLTWSATELIRRLTETNRLARQHGFRFCLVSGLEGMEEALATMQETTAFVCLFDNSAGYTELNNTPHTRRTKTLAFCLRHAEGMEARNTAMNILRELHRQFCSAILREMTRIREQMHYVDPRITMQETSRYLMPGTAVCIAELQITHYTDLRYRADEWEKE